MNKSFNKTIEQKIIKFITEFNLVEPGDSIIAGFSGGPDSTLLLYFLKKYSDKYKINLSAFHLNHNIRENEAIRDQNFCKEFCERNDIKLFIYSEDVIKYSKENKLSVEEAGRTLRYNILNDLCEKNKFNKIALGHNLNDNTETVFLNIIKGAGIKGASGIPVKRDRIIRPLMCLLKEEIINYLSENNIKYVFDSSNENADYERNFLRLNIIPLIKKQLNSKLDKSIFNLSENLSNANRTLINYFEKQPQLLVPFESGYKVKVQELKNIDKNELTYRIKKEIEEKLKIDLSFDNIISFLSIINKKNGKKILLPGNLITIKERDYIFIYDNSLENDKYLKPIKIDESVRVKDFIIYIERAERDEITFNNDKAIEYIDADDIDEEFIIRMWNTGDTFNPIGLKGSKKVSDFFTDLKMSNFEKQNQLILENRGRIVWLIGKRIDERFKIKPYTHKILKIECNKDEFGK